LARFTRPDGRSHDSGKFPGPPERPSSPSSNNRLCNLFQQTVLRHSLRLPLNLSLVRPLQPFRRSRAAGRVHAQSNGPSLSKTEAATRVVELRRGNAEIEEHSVDLARAQRVEGDLPAR